MDKKFLFLIDDGWRYDRREMLYYLKGKLDFDVATYDPLTYEKLSDDFQITLLKKYSPRSILYYLVMFFAKEIDTSVARTVRRIRFHSSPWHVRLLERTRQLLGRLGVRCYTYYPAHRFLFRHSKKHTEFLDKYDALVYSPVHVQNKRVVYEAINQGLKIVCWVYSWDNPLKENEFIPDADRYLVWNQETSELVQRMYGVSPSIIDIVGPIQFDYLLKKNQDTSVQKKETPYILFTCSVGLLDFYIEQEIQLILLVRRLLDEIGSSIRFVVRPYPTAGEEQAYKDLEEHDDIEVVQFGSYKRWSVIETTERDLNEKYEQIRQASCLISLGSTIALEASFTDTPILQIAFNLPNSFKEWQDLNEVYKNEHLGLIIDDRYPNVVRDSESLKRALRDIVEGRSERYMEYSAKLQKFARPFEADSYRSVFLKALKDLP